jgi:hypothetical protein
LLLQVNQLKELSQSSCSAEISEKLIENKNQAKKAILMTKQFWKNPSF